MLYRINESALRGRVCVWYIFMTDSNQSNVCQRLRHLMSPIVSDLWNIQSNVVQLFAFQWNTRTYDAMWAHEIYKFKIDNIDRLENT